jgi:hypothetical protein
MNRLYLKFIIFLSMNLLLSGHYAYAQTLAGKPVRYYLRHPQISQVAKDIYLEKKKVSDDDLSLSLMDSLFTKNPTTQPFYFLVLTRAMKKADGAYSELLGVTAKSFVESEPELFVQYFGRESVLTVENWDQWAWCVASEIMIEEEGNEETASRQFKEMVSARCATCSQATKVRLVSFLNLVTRYCRK